MLTAPGANTRNAVTVRGSKKRGYILREQRRSLFFLHASYCTVNVADPVVPRELAPMVVVPAALHCAMPATLGALAMVATEADDELQ